MMKSVAIFLLILFVICAPLDCFSEEFPLQLSVLIVGGGPAGLATAIEAHQQGAEVTIVEKRSAYTRIQMVFLIESSLNLLKKWQVSVPNLHVVDFGEGEKMGFVKINDLEKGLDERVKILGINKIHGEFSAFSDAGIHVVSAGERRTFDLPYDIVVAADGVRSNVREELRIQCKKRGFASGTWAFSIFPDSSGALDISEFIYRPGYVLRRISMPHASLILMQSHVNHPIPVMFNVDTLLWDALDCGWLKEAAVIATGQATIVANIEIVFQQALLFSDRAKRAILVGDTAATASFFHGMGVNTALKTAVHAGEFFKEVRYDADGAFNAFQHHMQTTTDDLIHYCEFLLPPATSLP